MAWLIQSSCGTLCLVFIWIILIRSSLLQTLLCFPVYVGLELSFSNFNLNCECVERALMLLQLHNAGFVIGQSIIMPRE